MKIAMLYDDDAYLELPDRRLGRSDRRKGLWGRHVAGKEFLDAFLYHGTWQELVAVVRNRSSRESIIDRCRNHPSSRDQTRRLQIVDEKDFHSSFFPEPPADLLYVPQPPDPKYAWARQYGGPTSFSICGVTHTLCTPQANRWLISLVTAPFEEFDTLICTSTAVVRMVRDVVGAYTDFLRDRFGGQPRLKAKLECVPLGVNTTKFSPAEELEKDQQRARLGIDRDEIVVLFVGRLSAHSKVHPFPMYAGLAEAARRTRQKVRLLISGWAENDKVLKAYLDGGRQFADNVRITVVDGTSAEDRFGAWKAADIFTSLSDNIQETFGLVIVEAMAAGLPVVASDWDGYRDLVDDGQTGLLVPTAMMAGATASSTSRLILGEISYAQFLGECNQASIVDVSATAEAFVRLISDPALRRRMGIAGRARAVELFSWEKVISVYESLWEDQEHERQKHIKRAENRKPRSACPSIYPPLEDSFSGYPTQWLTEDMRVIASKRAASHLKPLLELPISNYAGHRRITEIDVLNELLDQARIPTQLGELRRDLMSRGNAAELSDSTLAWMLKYGLLERVDAGW